MTVVYILLGLVGTVLLVAALLPSSYSISKSIVISRTPLEVHRKIADLRFYKEWNPWQKTDPGATATITGAPDTVGHRYGWNGKKVGEGSLTLRKRDPGQSIEFDLEFLRPFKSRADDLWTMAPQASGTHVTWLNHGKLPYPMARLFGPILSKQLDKQFQAGLQDLKALCERS